MITITYDLITYIELPSHSRYKPNHVGHWIMCSETLNTQCSTVVLTLLYGRPANGKIGGIRTPKPLIQFLQNLAWVITSAI